MSGAWRTVGLNYIDYSTIAARLLRQALKPELRAEAAKRNESYIKFTTWLDGKPAAPEHDHHLNNPRSFEL